MSDMKVEGADLKAMVKVSRKGPIGFAFNPGKSDSEHFLAMHRKRPGALLGKEAKKEGPGVKVAFGTCLTNGKDLELTCERTVPALAKVLKKYLKSQKVSLNVKVLDADGNVLDEDIDEGDAPEEAAEAATPDADGPTGDTSALVARVKAAQAALARVPEEIAAKLKPALVQVAGSLKAGDTGGAGDGLDKIEAVLAKLAARVTTDGPADTDAAAPAPAPDSAGQAELVARIRAVSAGLADLSADAAGKLQEAIRTAVALVKAGDTDKAATALDRIEAAVAKLSGQADAAPAEASEPEGADPMVIWRQAKERADEGITALQSALKAHGHPELKKLADKGLNGVAAGNQTAMMKALFEYRGASGDGRVTAAQKLRGQVGAYRKFITSDRTVALCEANPFGVSVSIRTPLIKALDDIEAVLPA